MMHNVVQVGVIKINVKPRKNYGRHVMKKTVLIIFVKQMFVLNQLMIIIYALMIIRVLVLFLIMV